MERSEDSKGKKIYRLLDKEVQHEQPVVQHRLLISHLRGDENLHPSLQALKF